MRGGHPPRLARRRDERPNAGSRPANGLGIDGGHVAGEHPRAIRGPDTFGVEQILDPDRDTRQCAHSLPSEIRSLSRASFL